MTYFCPNLTPHLLNIQSVFKDALKNLFVINII